MILLRGEDDKVLRPLASGLLWLLLCELTDTEQYKSHVHQLVIKAVKKQINKVKDKLIKKS